jgi:hypothetical protein
MRSAKSLVCLVFVLAWCRMADGTPINALSQCSRHLQVARRLFGDEVQTQLHLFEVNKDYAVNLKTDVRCEVASLEIAPKYFWQESVPQWKEPDHLVGLPEKEYQSALEKAGKIRAIGSLLDKGAAGVVTNSKLWLTDQYEYAFVVRRIHSTADPVRSSPELVHSFSVYFIRRIEGVVEDKLMTELDGGKRSKVKIDGKWYLTALAEFNKARLGQRAVLAVAGPL